MRASRVVLDPAQMNTSERAGPRIRREIFRTVRGRERHDAHAGRSGRLDSCGRIFHDDAVGRRDAQAGCGHEVHVRAGLAVQHVFGTYQDAGNREAGVPETLSCSRTGARGSDGPAPHGEGLQQAGGSFDGFQSVAIPRVIRHKRGNLSLGIEVGSGKLDGFERPPAVTDAQKRLDREPLGPGPAAPLVLDIGGGVYQHAVEIEQYRATFEASHGRRRLPANFDPVRTHA
jgi:hypothetical protein